MKDKIIKLKNGKISTDELGLKNIRNENNIIVDKKPTNLVSIEVNCEDKEYYKYEPKKYHYSLSTKTTNRDFKDFVDDEYYGYNTYQDEYGWVDSQGRFHFWEEEGLK